MLRRASFVALVSFIGVLNIAMAQKEIPSVANSVADDVAATGKKSIAVVDFTDLQGNATELGRFLAEELALGLVTSKKGLSVVDRTHLRSILQEHKLASSGLIDPSTARKLGQITGVEALVTGSLTVLGDSIRLVVKVLDTSTAQILTAASADIARTKTIEDLMGRDIGSSPGLPVSRRTSALESASVDQANSPVYRNAFIRVTLGQASVSSGNYRAAVSVVIENISRQALYLAVTRGRLGSVNVTLSDDRATEWELRGLSGLSILPWKDRESERTRPEQSDFTLIAPADRVTLVMTFSRLRGDREPGTVFSFGVQGASWTPSGMQGMSIGLAGIKATVRN